MIQDLFAAMLPRINAKFKDICFISNEEGKILLTEIGQLLQLPAGQNTFDLNYLCATGEEFVDTLTGWNQRPTKAKYPVWFVNIDTIDIQYDYAMIGEMVLATHSDPKWNSKKRDAYSFKPILNNIYRFIDEGIKESPDLCYYDFPQSHSVNPKYFYGRNGLYSGKADTFKDNVDAIEIKNLKVRMF